MSNRAIILYYILITRSTAPGIILNDVGGDVSRIFYYAATTVQCVIRMLLLDLRTRRESNPSKQYNNIIIYLGVYSRLVFIRLHRRRNE